MKLGTCKLGELGKVSLGFKSLQNQFFYVSQKTIREFHIEKRFLRPILQLKDLDANQYKQRGKAVQRVFYCQAKEADLRGTGARRYIRGMENLPAVEKKQTGKHQTIREALEAQSGGVWYAPKARLHRAHIWLRKAFNSTFSPFIFETAVALDQRCNYVLPRVGLEWEVLGAVLTSSLFGLAAESFGSASMGAGALEIPTTKVQDVRVIDVRGITDPAEKTQLVSLANVVWTRTAPVDWFSADRPPQEVQQLDSWLLSRMGASVTLEKVYIDLVQTLRARLAIARDKVVSVKEGVRVDIMALAQGVADTVRPVLESRSFPESFAEQGTATQRVDFSGAARLEVECHPLMSQAIVLVRDGADHILLEAQYPRSVAQVIVKAMLLGRRNFAFPIDPGAATAVLKGFSPWLAKLLNKIQTGCGLSAVGTRYEEDVHNAVLQTLDIDRNISTQEFYGHFQVRG